MINFLHPQLKPTVACSCVCEDAYPASNLISENIKSQQGFLAFSVTKPPINLTFDFPYAIEIHKIKIWSSMGALKSTAFEIHTKRDQQREYLKVAHVDNLLIEDVVSFCRNPTSSLDKQIQFFSYKHANNSLNAAISVIVKIKETIKCPPVLRKIEVWGLPARFINKIVKKNIHKIWDEILYPREIIKNNVTSTQTTKTSKSSTSNYNNIPEEFLDQLTYEIMTFPMIMPSGKVVDQSTIEKHSYIEEKWGRLPSDPFTGQTFTADRKPMLDLTLKARIERFVLTNSNNPAMKTLPRTLGQRTTGNKRKIETFVPASKNPPVTFEQLHTEKKAKFQISMNSTLENDVKEALKNITRYSAPLVKPKMLSAVCVYCKCSDNLYQIKTCEHFVCRICLSDISKKNICYCQAIYKSSDVQKYNN